MMQNKVMPKLRFREFSGDWESKTLGELGKVVNGLTYSPSDIDDSGILVLRSSNIQNNMLSLEDNVYVKTLKYNPVRENDILICVRNGSKNLIGKNIIIPKSIEGVAFGAFMTIYRSDYNRFLIHWFKTYKYNKYVYCNLGATINSINGNDLINFKLNLPSLAEQEKIANYLSALDEKINLLSAKAKELLRYKKAMMQKLFAQEIRFKDDEGKAFAEWEETIGGDIFISHTNKNHDGTLDILAITQEHGAIPRKLIDYSVQVSDESVNNYKVVEKNDFIISLRSFQGGIEHSNYYGICSPAYIILRNKIPIVPLFYKAFFKSKNYINYLNRTLEGIRDGKMISYANFAKSKLPYPSLAEQQKIADFLSAIDEKINTVQEQISNMQSFKKAMLQQMFV